MYVLAFTSLILKSCVYTVYIYTLLFKSLGSVIVLMFLMESLMLIKAFIYLIKNTGEKNIIAISNIGFPF